MKHSAIALLLLMASAAGLAQTHTWRDVEQLRVGTDLRIITTTREHVRCKLVSVDDNLLTCEPVQIGVFGWFGPSGDYRFERPRIAEVRIEHREGNRAVTALFFAALAGLVGGGGGAGVAVGFVCAIPVASLTYLSRAEIHWIRDTKFYKQPPSGLGDGAAPPVVPSGTTAAAPASSNYQSNKVEP